MKTRVFKTGFGISAGALLVLTPLLSTGQDTGFYMKGDLGGALTPDVELKSFFGPVSSGSEVRFDPGLRYGITLGYQVTDWFAAEFETGGISHNLDGITDATYVNGWLSNIPLMVNAKLQYKNSSPITPYVGAGAGGVISVLDLDYIELNGQGASGTKSDAVFAFQGFAGVKVELNEHASVGAEYRYVWSDSPAWEADWWFGAPNDEIRFGKVQSHCFSLIFEWRF